MTPQGKPCIPVEHKQPTFQLLFAHHSTTPRTNCPYKYSRYPLLCFSIKQQQQQQSKSSLPTSNLQPLQQNFKSLFFHHYNTTVSTYDYHCKPATTTLLMLKDNNTKSKKMAKKKMVFSRKAWNLLRLALLWARKGGVWKRGVMVELRLLPNYLKKTLGHTHRHASINYREKEFSFDETPLFHFKMHRPNSMRCLPCIKPRVDYDYDFDVYDDDDGVYNQEGRKSFLKGDDERVEEYGYDEEIEGGEGKHTEMIAVEDEAIDDKAEEFISKFYEQMKLQRQISYLQYNEMLNRGTS